MALLAAALLALSAAVSAACKGETASASQPATTAMGVFRFIISEAFSELVRDFGFEGSEGAGGSPAAARLIISAPVFTSSTTASPVFAIIRSRASRAVK